MCGIFFVLDLSFQYFDRPKTYISKNAGTATNITLFVKVRFIS